MKIITAAAVLQIIASTPEAQMWPRPLVVQYVDGDTWRFRAPFSFVSPAPFEFPSVEIDEGFETNFASIPRLFWWIMHPTHKQIAKAAVVHDAYYRWTWMAVSREQADRVLPVGMQVLGAPGWKRKAVYRGCRIGGRGSFRPRRVA